MNRLIIIGNGFDLAHRMKTSFKDFITDYYNNAINIFYQEGKYDDVLLSMSLKGYSSWGDKRVIDIKDTFTVLSDLKNYDFTCITIKSLLLNRIIESIETKKWVDIETEYFNLLVMSSDPKPKIYVSDLNMEFDFLKNKLIGYLRKQQDDFLNVFDLSPLVKCFTQRVHYKELNDKRSKKILDPASLYFLNFNYTNTCEPYIAECRKKIKSSINYIHGDLDGKRGTPVFGFGDEFDKKFLEIEEKSNNEYFKHIKSFEYSKNQNYASLLAFIESGEFQVHIYGHSCGISDRTMLRSIFEEDNCKSIKIFHYEQKDGSNDFVERTYEIYRHFINKGVMRKKVVSLELCESMPQPQPQKVMVEV